LAAGVVAAVGDPEGDVAASEGAADLDGIQQVREGVPANFGARVADGPELVLLVLKQIWVDRTRTDVVFALEILDFRDVGFAVGKIPEDVQAAAGWENLPKRVPVLAKPQEGISMRKRSRAVQTRCLSCSSWLRSKVLMRHVPRLLSFEKKISIETLTRVLAAGALCQERCDALSARRG
jgi:hypothetical protein